MTEPTENPYQVLGVDRAADERAIKKAYFTLIRKHPPDSQPEEFKRVRQAYEILSDPVARRRYDAMDRDYAEYGDESGAALREAEAAANAGDEAEAQRKLRLLLEKQPDLTVARENLVGLLLKASSFEDALKEIDKLRKAKPEEARYAAQRAFVLHRLEKPDKARAALRKAHELAPEDIGIHLELIDMNIGHRHYDAALKEIDALLKKKKGDEKASDLLLLLRLRKLDALYGAGSEKASKLLSRIVREANESIEPELPKFVASQLASVAAKLFARNECEQANALLANASELYPDSAVLRPYPSEVTLDVSSLPAEGLEWLAGLKPGPTSPTIARPIWPAPIFELIVGAGLLIATFLIIFYEPAPPSVEFMVASALFIGISVAMVAISARRIVAILRSPLRAFLTVHPLYILNVSGTEIRVYPLFNLENVHAVHQHTNGAYTGTSVTLSFGRAKLGLTLSGQSFAEGWLQFLFQSRRRALELMLSGYLEAERGVDLLPPALLSQPRKEPDRRERQRYYGVVALAALAVWGASIALRSWAAREARWGAAVRAGSIAAYQKYIEENPGAAYEGAAKERVGAAFERARASLRVAAGDGSSSPAALLATLARLEESRQPVIPVMLLLDKSWPPGVRDDLLKRLSSLIAAAGLGDVARLETSGGSSAGAAVTLSIYGEAKPEGDAYASADGSEATARAIDWIVDIVGPDNSSILHWTTRVDAPDALRIPRRPGESSSDLNERVGKLLARRALDALFVRLPEALSIKSAAMPGQWEAPLQAADAKEASPYDR